MRPFVSSFSAHHAQHNNLIYSTLGAVLCQPGISILLQSILRIEKYEPVLLTCSFFFTHSISSIKTRSA